jgi:hypothetical protein
MQDGFQVVQRVQNQKQSARISGNSSSSSSITCAWGFPGNKASDDSSIACAWGFPGNTANDDISVISAIKLQGSIIHVLFDYGHDNSNND